MKVFGTLTSVLSSYKYTINQSIGFPVSPQVTKSTFFFGGETKVFKIENLLNLGELLKKECPMIIDDTLNLIVFVKAKSPPP